MPDHDERLDAHAAFSATRWTLIYAARRDSPEALETLLKRYWLPLYAYIRRSGHSKEDAEDLVQGFFGEWLSRDFLKNLAPENGKFRSFLLACYKNYASNVRERESALKRGGGKKILPLELEGLEGSYTIEPVDHLTPEKLYERRWAMTMFDNVIAEVATEYEGRDEIFRVLEPFLRDENDCNYKQAAEKLGMTENAFKQALFRLRKFFRARLRSQVAQTLSSPEDVDQEIRDLLAAIA